MNTLDAAHDYLRRGWRILPTAAGTKQCYLAGWPSLILEPAALRHYFGDGENIAVVLGPPSGEMIDVDLDCDEALALADIYLPPTGAVFGRASRPLSHRLYIAAGARFAAFADPSDGDMLIELRAGGAHQTLLPPSVADGEQRQWHDGPIAPAGVEAHKLRRRCAYLAIGCLLARHVSAHAARQPKPDLAHLLWEADETLGRAAFHWLGEFAPGETPRSNRPRRRIAGDVDIAQVVAAIPNNDLPWPEWNVIGMAIFAATCGSKRGFQIFDTFSSPSNKYNPRQVIERWSNYQRSPPTKLNLGSLIHRARQTGWQP